MKGDTKCIYIYIFPTMHLQCVLMLKTQQQAMIWHVVFTVMMSLMMQFLFFLFPFYQWAHYIVRMKNSLDSEWGVMSERLILVNVWTPSCVRPDVSSPHGPCMSSWLEPLLQPGSRLFLPGLQRRWSGPESNHSNVCGSTKSHSLAGAQRSVCPSKGKLFTTPSIL